VRNESDALIEVFLERRLSGLIEENPFKGGRNHCISVQRLGVLLLGIVAALCPWPNVMVATLRSMQKEHKVIF
jgi:hypothetical protein